MIYTQEEHDLVLSQLRKKPDTEKNHISRGGKLLYVDKDGEVVFEKKGNTPLINTVEKLDKNGKPIMIQAVTVDDWLENIPPKNQKAAWKEKVKSCRKRAHTRALKIK